MQRLRFTQNVSFSNDSWDIRGYCETNLEINRIMITKGVVMKTVMEIEGRTVIVVMLDDVETVKTQVFRGGPGFNYEKKEVQGYPVTINGNREYIVHGRADRDWRGSERSEWNVFHYATGDDVGLLDMAKRVYRKGHWGPKGRRGPVSFRFETRGEAFEALVDFLDGQYDECESSDDDW